MRKGQRYAKKDSIGFICRDFYRYCDCDSLCRAQKSCVILKIPISGIGVSAVSAILIEADTGTVLFSKNEKEHRQIASTTKIMTALLTLEAGEPDKEFEVDPTAIKVEGTSMGLREGDIVTRRALCYGMLLPSGNDAANAAAVNISKQIGFCRADE